MRQWARVEGEQKVRMRTRTWVGRCSSMSFRRVLAVWWRLRDDCGRRGRDTSLGAARFVEDLFLLKRRASCREQPTVCQRHTEYTPQDPQRLGEWWTSLFYDAVVPMENLRRDPGGFTPREVECDSQRDSQSCLPRAPSLCYLEYV